MKNIYDCILESNNDIKHGNPPKIKKEDVIPYLQAFYSIINQYYNPSKISAGVSQYIIVSKSYFAWLADMICDWLPEYLCDSLPYNDKTDINTLNKYDFWESKLYKASSNEINHRKQLIKTFKEKFLIKWPDERRLLCYIPEFIKKLIYEFFCTLDGKPAVYSKIEGKTLSDYLQGNSYNYSNNKYKYWSSENIQKMKKYEKIISAEIEKIYNEIIINNTEVFKFNPIPYPKYIK